MLQSTIPTTWPSGTKLFLRGQTPGLKPVLEKVALYRWDKLTFALFVPSSSTVLLEYEELAAHVGIRAIEMENPEEKLLMLTYNQRSWSRKERSDGRCGSGRNWLLRSRSFSNYR